jgi:Kef-type K+ transport system membrane component KefB
MNTGGVGQAAPPGHFFVPIFFAVVGESVNLASLAEAGFC